jgi:hypothetical protein
MCPTLADNAPRLPAQNIHTPLHMCTQFEKWNDVRTLPPLMDVVSGPLPNRCANRWPTAGAAAGARRFWLVARVVHLLLLAGQPTHAPPPQYSIRAQSTQPRFITSYLGNRTIALSPDVPEHALRPTRINCPAPAAKVVAVSGSSDSSSSSSGGGSSRYATAAAAGGAWLGRCPLSVFLEYKQVC